MSEPTAVYRIHFECGHAASIFGDEYGDGSAWCQTCGKFQVYDRCWVCRSLDCEHPRRDPDASCDDEDSGGSTHLCTCPAGNEPAKPNYNQIRDNAAGDIAALLDRAEWLESMLGGYTHAKWCNAPEPDEDAA